MANLKVRGQSFISEGQPGLKKVSCETHFFAIEWMANLKVRGQSFISEGQPGRDSSLVLEATR
jgi:hypothetical protein